MYSAWKISKELLNLKPSIVKFQNNVKIYEKMVGDPHAFKNDVGILFFSIFLFYNNINYFKPPNKEERSVKLTKQLCTNKLRKSVKELSRLRCRYVTNKSDFLKMAPFKLEQLNLDPIILLYHDVLGDSEIALLKEQSIRSVN